MLVIRMQRTGRKGHAMFRVVVQDSRRTPTSGKVVAHVGSYDPHSKTVSINKEKAQFYLDHGAQPSERVTRLLKAEGIKLPKWVALSDVKAGKLRNPEKLRKNRPAEPKPAEAPAEEPAPAETPAETPSESEATEAPAAEAPAEEATAETAAAEDEAAANVPAAEEAAAETTETEAPGKEDSADEEKPA